MEKNIEAGILAATTNNTIALMLPARKQTNPGKKKLRITASAPPVKTKGKKCS